MKSRPHTAAAAPPLLDDDVARALSGPMLASPPADDCLLDRVRGRLLATIAGESGQQHATVRADDASWEQVAPGVQRMLLFETADAVSCMMRLSPGAVVPGHGHPIDEECIVLEGTLRIGDLLLLPGDFHVGRRGVPHAAAGTDTGALVYLRGARPTPALSR